MKTLEFVEISSHSELNGEPDMVSTIADGVSGRVGFAEVGGMLADKSIFAHEHKLIFGSCPLQAYTMDGFQLVFNVF